MLRQKHLLILPLVALLVSVIGFELYRSYQWEVRNHLMTLANIEGMKELKIRDGVTYIRPTDSKSLLYDWVENFVDETIDDGAVEKKTIIYPVVTESPLLNTKSYVLTRGAYESKFPFVTSSWSQNIKFLYVSETGEILTLEDLVKDKTIFRESVAQSFAHLNKHNPKMYQEIVGKFAKDDWSRINFSIVEDEIHLGDYSIKLSNLIEGLELSHFPKEKVEQYQQAHMIIEKGIVYENPK